jgi:hypothetical protein
MDAIGDLSANLNLNVEELSDFGTLTTIGYGLNWRPVSEVTLIASVTEEEGAPGIQQLGEPAIATPNVRIFDFVRGETIDITRIDGGNAALLADSRRVINFGANVRPLEGLSIRANYTDTRIDNPIASFPAATSEIEAAFPDRFVRDAGGRLVSIDTRPVNFASSERRELRWGFDFSAPFGPQGPHRSRSASFASSAVRRGATARRGERRRRVRGRLQVRRARGRSVAKAGAAAGAAASVAGAAVLVPVGSGEAVSVGAALAAAVRAGGFSWPCSTRGGWKTPSPSGKAGRCSIS